MKTLKQIKEESKSKSSPVVKKKGFIPHGFVPQIEIPKSSNKSK